MQEEIMCLLIIIIGQLARIDASLTKQWTWIDGFICVCGILAILAGGVGFAFFLFH